MRRSDCHVVLAGHHRGRLATLANLRDACRELATTASILAVDAIPARRAETMVAARELGLTVDEGPGSLVECRREGLLDAKPLVIIGFDSPRAVAEALDICAALHLGCSLGLFIELPGWPLAGFRAVVAETDDITRDRVRHLANRLVRLTTHTGSSALFGPDRRPENQLVELPIRRDFFRVGIRAGLRQWLGLEPDAATTAMTLNGKLDLPTIILDARAGALDPARLASSVSISPPFPLVPGQEIAIVQLPPDDSLVVDRARLKQHRATVDIGIDRAKRTVVSAFNPVRMSD